jgi:hypothetical protein
MAGGIDTMTDGSQATVSKHRPLALCRTSCNAIVRAGVDRSDDANH